MAIMTTPKILGTSFPVAIIRAMPDDRLEGSESVNSVSSYRSVGGGLGDWQKSPRVNMCI